jgi:septal ring factor EnvC (AmiA/AmiB activator)
MTTEQLNALEEKIKKLREQLAEISGALVELQYDLKQKSSSS